MRWNVRQRSRRSLALGVKYSPGSGGTPGRGSWTGGASSRGQPGVSSRVRAGGRETGRARRGSSSWTLLPLQERPRARSPVLCPPGFLPWPPGWSRRFWRSLSCSPRGMTSLVRVPGQRSGRGSGPRREGGPKHVHLKRGKECFVFGQLEQICPGGWCRKTVLTQLCVTTARGAGMAPCLLEFLDRHTRINLNLSSPLPAISPWLQPRLSDYVPREDEQAS